jgi:hypothetical protein
MHIQPNCNRMCHAVNSAEEMVRDKIDIQPTCAALTAVCELTLLSWHELTDNLAWTIVLQHHGRMWQGSLSITGHKKAPDWAALSAAAEAAA